MTSWMASLLLLISTVSLLDVCAVALNAGVSSDRSTAVGNRQLSAYYYSPFLMKASSMVSKQAKDANRQYSTDPTFARAIQTILNSRDPALARFFQAKASTEPLIVPLNTPNSDRSAEENKLRQLKETSEAASTIIKLLPQGSVPTPTTESLEILAERQAVGRQLKPATITGPTIQSERTASDDLKTAGNAFFRNLATASKEMATRQKMTETRIIRDQLRKILRDHYVSNKAKSTAKQTQATRQKNVLENVKHTIG